MKMKIDQNITFYLGTHLRIHCKLRKSKVAITCKKFTVYILSTGTETFMTSIFGSGYSLDNWRVNKQNAPS